MRKNDERLKRESCFNKALPNEWLFVLLARDPAAPVAVRMWCEVRVAMGLNEPDDPQIVEALKWCEEAMVQRADPAFAVDVALRKANGSELKTTEAADWLTMEKLPSFWKNQAEFLATELPTPTPNPIVLPRDQAAFDRLYLNTPPGPKPEPCKHPKFDIGMQECPECGRTRRAIIAEEVNRANTPPEVYCHGCSVAGGAMRAVYHDPPVCEPAIWKNEAPALREAAEINRPPEPEPEGARCRVCGGLGSIEEEDGVWVCPCTREPEEALTTFPRTCRKCAEAGVPGEGVLVGGLCYDHAEQCERCGQPMDPTVPHTCTPSNDPGEWPQP